MANGVFGSVRPANIDPSVDVDMYYYYRPSRGETDENFKGFKKLNPGDCLTKSVDDTETENTIIGMYNLKLPLETFNKKGFYTIYIKPKERKTLELASLENGYLKMMNISLKWNHLRLMKYW